MHARTRQYSLLGTGLVLVSTLGCGEGDPAEPLLPADVGGRWQFRFGLMTGPGVRCGPYAIEYVITQSGNTFTGVVDSGYSISCSEGGMPEHITSSISDGEVAGNSVTFELAMGEAEYVGTVEGDAMNGSSTWTYVVNPHGTVVATGAFEAERVP